MCRDKVVSGGQSGKQKVRRGFIYQEWATLMDDGDGGDVSAAGGRYLCLAGACGLGFTAIDRVRWRNQVDRT